MNSATPSRLRAASAGFTLIEMIGVLAIMALIATAITPSALRSIERAAVRAEADTLRAYAEQLKLYVCDTDLLPTSANWDAALATYASANPTDLLYNRRQRTSGVGAIPRLYVPDPVAANQRALFLSSMRQDVALPSAALVAGNFAAIWNWNSSDPANPPPAVLAAWIPDLREFLVIERVNFRSVAQLQFVLRNSSATPATYRIFGANGNQIGLPGTVPARAGAVDGSVVRTCRPNQRIVLYDGANNPNYSYVVSTNPKNFAFDGAGWISE